jgi:enediyne biosynthesis protein E4
MNHGGHFEPANPGTNALVAARGAAFGDLNNDGSIDVVTTILGRPPQLFMNRGGSSHWLTITLRGTRSNRDGLGARVVVNGQVRFATTAGSYESASDKRLHFGLGDAKSVKGEVFWPSGEHQVLNDLAVDRFVEVREPERR